MSSDFQNRLAKGLEHDVAEQHPSADMLNAYSERLLSKAEEQQVVAHLSVCADCREIVYLASAVNEEEPAAVVSVAPSRQVRWWTWAVPLLAVLIVGSTVFLLRPERNPRVSPPAEVAQARRDVPSSPPPATGLEPYATMAPSEEVPKKLEGSKDKLPQVKQEQQASKRQREALPPTLSADASPSTSDRLEVKAKAAANAPIPAAPVTQAGAQSATINVTNENALVASEASSSQVAPARDVIGRAAGYSLAKSSVQRADAAPLWRVTPDGKLEHFLLGEWKPALTAPHADFLTASSAGNDVWAGGKSSALYHSSDNGLHWEQQVLPTAQTDIVHIEFSSVTNGVLKTSSAGAFSTHDGGKTWVGADGP